MIAERVAAFRAATGEKPVAKVKPEEDGRRRGRMRAFAAGREECQ
jgi:hypothetical protein